MGCLKDADNSFELLSLIILCALSFLRILPRLEPGIHEEILTVVYILYFTPTVGFLIVDLVPFVLSWLRVFRPSWELEQYRQRETSKDKEEELFAVQRLQAEIEETACAEYSPRQYMKSQVTCRCYEVLPGCLLVFQPCKVDTRVAMCVQKASPTLPR